jgi:N utilization substance protein A
VDDGDLTAIDGFDADTAAEIKRRAQGHLAAVEAEHDAKRKELGVLDELREIPGVTTAMMAKFGENGVLSIEDLAGCATDDLAGWTERKDGQTQRYLGYLDGFDMGRDECEALIMAARVKAGWIEQTPVPAEGEAAGDGATAA